MELDGRVALITGGSRGIGRAIAERFVTAGAQVMIVSRRAEVLEATAKEIGDGCHWMALNVGHADAGPKAVAETIERLGSCDILVNNAATNPYAGPTIDVDLPRWDKTIQVNLTAPLLWTQAAWNQFMAANGGVVINIASVGGLMTNPDIGVYDLTKSALIHLTQQLGAELGPDVRVNALCPGLIKTDFARMLWEGPSGDERASSYPLERLGEVTDIANAALFLAADTGSWITGQHFVIDGGGLVSFRR